jgi:hypothetical protein
MTKLTRNQIAEAILAQLRGVGPQSIAEIQDDLRITKREVEGAIWLLANRGDVEYTFPYTSPLIYKATSL